MHDIGLSMLSEPNEQMDHRESVEHDADFFYSIYPDKTSDKQKIPTGCNDVQLSFSMCYRDRY